ncbi:hypothetical protein SAMN06265379_104246 [Saccharicrinis carchari]|uniref:Fn3-like domain-containing protein n=1 Tax=Saccharicrinis carchari TaxID=1168039 RepID=A0A521D6T9_SACCC|nr:molecular chaperone [Saccharicrinis carchari]SMO66791.1 hypothetical protein SAMN06265379_104246 [Saccharicrinis carchari]
MRNIFLSLTLIMFTAIWGTTLAQSVSVSPSRLYFKEAPGSFRTQTIRVSNNGNKAESFQITFNNFTSEGNQGKTQIVEEGNERGCSHWLSATPAFFELEPGTSQEVKIMLQVPNTPEANNVRWAIAAVKLAKEKTGSGSGSEQETGMQIVQTFQFLIHIFQTPPTAKHKEANVLSFNRLSQASDSVQMLGMEVANVGETILDCAPYLDIVNISTGVSQRIKARGFSILPGGQREIKLHLPKDLPKGKYSILGVIDYGSDSDLAGAELELELL